MGHPDVVIVGAGIAGWAVAWQLRGARSVIVVDRGPRPASEASGDGVGMIRRLSEDPVERALALRTARWLREAAAAGGPLADSGALRTSGALIGAAHDPTHLADAVAHLRAAGVQVDAVEAADVVPREVCPAGLARAWWIHDELLADPPALVAALAASARSVGVSSRYGVRATGIRVRDGRAIGVDTDDGPIHADQVVLAAGAWCAELARDVGLDRPLVALRRSVLTVAARPPADAPWVWVDDVGVYARPTAEAWWVSPCDETASVPSPAASRGDPRPDAGALAAAKLARHLPGLAGAAITGGWSGLRTFATDRRPLLGEDAALPGLWWAAGLGGFGLTCGAAAGEAVATWMRGESTPWLDPRIVAPARPFPRAWAIRPTGDAEHAALVRR